MMAFTMSDKGHIIAFAIALAPAGVVAWLCKSRTVFVAGAIGAFVGLFFAPNVTGEYSLDATERDRILDTVFWDVPWTLGGALIASVFFQLISRNPAAKAKAS
jgi:hypothetical protein